MVLSASMTTSPSHSTIVVLTLAFSQVHPSLGDVQKRYKEEMMRYRMQNNRSAHGDDLQAA